MLNSMAVNLCSPPVFFSLTFNAQSVPYFTFCRDCCHVEIAFCHILFAYGAVFVGFLWFFASVAENNSF